MDARMSDNIVVMLEDALERAKRGEIAGLALVVSDPSRTASAGYVEGDHLQSLETGLVHLLHSIKTNPPYEFEDTFPSRYLRPIY